MNVFKAGLGAFACGVLALAGAPAVFAQDAEDELDKAEAAAARAEVDAMAEEALERLLASDERIEEQHDDAAGYAVFRATKAGFIVTGAGGTGVVVGNDDDERTYMHMASGGVGFGAGVQSYRVIFLFETEAALDGFMNGGWDAATAAQAAAGKDGANAASSFVDGVAVYQLTEKGLMAQADLSGTRFWKSEKLNAPSG